MRNRGAHRHAQFHCYRLSNADPNRADLYVSKPLLLGGDLVFPNGEQSERVKAASAGHGGSLQARVAVACGNLSVGNSGFGRIRDAAGNGSGQGLLSRGEEWDRQKKPCKVKSSNHRLKTPDRF